jgi:hypothetical protein
VLTPPITETGLARADVELLRRIEAGIPLFADLSHADVLLWVRGAEPGLAVYRHYFEALQARKPHVRSSEVETVLAAVSDPLGGHSATAAAATTAVSSTPAPPSITFAASIACHRTGREHRKSAVPFPSSLAKADAPMTHATSASSISHSPG